MSDLPVERAIVRTFWRDLNRELDTAMKGIETGEGETVKNPFTGQSVALELAEAVKNFRTALEDDELYEDPEFLSALRALIRDISERTMFSFFAAVDGSAGFVDEVAVSVCDGDGNELNHCFHEIFFEEDPQRQDS
jgi:hypothetical protein